MKFSNQVHHLKVVLWFVISAPLTLRSSKYSMSAVWQPSLWPLLSTLNLLPPTVSTQDRPSGSSSKVWISNMQPQSANLRHMKQNRESLHLHTPSNPLPGFLLISQRTERQDCIFIVLQRRLDKIYVKPKMYSNFFRFCAQVHTFCVYTIEFHTFFSWDA